MHAGREVSVAYHLRVSHLAVFHICRQVYLDAFPIFYGRESYYAANAQELIHILNFGQSNSVSSKIFRADKITTLCVKDIVPQYLHYKQSKHRSPWQIGGRQTSREAIDIQYLDDQLLSAVRNLNTWTLLNKICLCMRVGKELAFIQLLFEIPGLEQGMLDIHDDNKWTVRPQPDDHFVQWLYSYVDAMRTRSYVSLNNSLDPRKELYYASRPSKGLTGDERYVEVDIIQHNRDDQEMDNVSTYKALLNSVLSKMRPSLSMIVGLVALVIAFYLGLLMGDDYRHMLICKVYEMGEWARHYLLNI